MPKAPKIPVRVQRVVEACKNGQTICLTIRHSEVGDEKVYWLKPSASEKAHIVERLGEAAETLRWLERNERRIHAALSGGDAA